MSKKLCKIMSIFLLAIILSPILPYLFSKDYSIFVKIYIVIAEVILGIWISVLGVFIVNELIAKEHFDCRVIYPYKITKLLNDIFFGSFLLFLILKNIAVYCGKVQPELLYFIYMVCFSSLVVIFVILDNRLCVSDKIIYLLKYDKVVSLEDIKSVNFILQTKQMKIITVDNEYNFATPGKMLDEIEEYLSRNKVCITYDK